MAAKLLIREAGTSAFVAHNSDFPDADAAHAEGARLCFEGNIEEFEVWDLVERKKRKWTLEDA